MKNLLITVGVVLAGVLLIWWFMSSDKTDEMSAMNDNDGDVSQMDDGDMASVPAVSTKEMEAGTYTASVEKSFITWEAGKPAIVGYVHHGTFSLKSGEVVLSDSELSGEFVVDIDSLKVTSLGGGKVGQESTLEGHLKGDNFFAVGLNPTATFKIVSVNPEVLPGPDQSSYMATGELTLKGQTKEITFPIKVVVDESGVVWMTANVELDRTEWGISYGSAKIADKITNNIIGDTVKLELVVQLTK